MWTKRGKTCLILILSVAFRSFRSEKYSPTGRTACGSQAFLIPGCRLFLSWSRRSPKVSDCSPANRERFPSLPSSLNPAIPPPIPTPLAPLLSRSLSSPPLPSKHKQSGALRKRCQRYVDSAAVNSNCLTHQSPHLEVGVRAQKARTKAAR